MCGPIGMNAVKSISLISIGAESIVKQKIQQTYTSTRDYAYCALHFIEEEYMK